MGCSLALQHTTMSPRKRNTITTGGKYIKKGNIFQKEVKNLHEKRKNFTEKGHISHKKRKFYQKKRIFFNKKGDFFTKKCAREGHVTAKCLADFFVLTFTECPSTLKITGRSRMYVYQLNCCQENNMQTENRERMKTADTRYTTVFNETNSCKCVSQLKSWSP